VVAWPSANGVGHVNEVYSTSSPVSTGMGDRSQVRRLDM